MANPNEQPWTNAEKVEGCDDEPCVTLWLIKQAQLYMLAEVIKASGPRAEVLFGVINSIGLPMPLWEDIPLPPGEYLKWKHMSFEDD